MATSARLWPARTIPMKRSGGWTKRLSRDPNNARTQANLGAALGVKKRWADAEKHLRRAIELDSNVAITHFNLGHVLLARENLDEAIAQFEAAVRLEPGNPSYHHSLAVALSRAHQFDRAIDEYQAALKIAPEFVPARLDLAQTLADAGRINDCAGPMQRNFADRTHQPGRPETAGQAEVRRRPDGCALIAFDSGPTAAPGCQSSC